MKTATSAITFLDSDGDVISEYKPFGRTWNTEKYYIAENEEIIGVYGNKDNGRAF